MRFMRRILAACIRSKWRVLTYEEGDSFRVTRENSPELFDICFCIKDYLVHRGGVFRWEDTRGSRRWDRKVHRIIQPAAWHVSPSQEVIFLSPSFNSEERF